MSIVVDKYIISILLMPTRRVNNHSLRPQLNYVEAASTEHNLSVHTKQTESEPHCLEMRKKRDEGDGPNKHARVSLINNPPYPL